MSSSSRFLLNSISRPLPSTSRSIQTSSSVLYPSPSPPLRNPSEDSHGSKLSPATPNKRLRPRDRLQFIEASEQKGDETATPPEPVPPNYPGLSPLAPSPSSSSSSSSSSSNSSTSNDSGSSSPNHDSIILDPPYEGLPPLHTHPFHLPRIPFSTHRFIRQLEQQDVPRGTAEVLSGLTKKLILREEERVRDDLLSKQDLENVRYLSLLYSSSPMGSS